MTEFAEAGTILFKLNATDADVSETNSALTYHLLEEPENAGLFIVNSMTGDVSLVWGLDYELKREHSLKVEARDVDEQACLYSLRIRVLDTNDNAPLFDQPIEISPVPENAPVGSLVGKVHATDVDSGKITFPSLLFFGPKKIIPLASVFGTFSLFMWV